MIFNFFLQNVQNNQIDRDRKIDSCLGLEMEILEFMLPAKMLETSFWSYQCDLDCRDGCI